MLPDVTERQSGQTWEDAASRDLTLTLHVNMVNTTSQQPPSRGRWPPRPARAGPLDWLSGTPATGLFETARLRLRNRTEHEKSHTDRKAKPGGGFCEQTLKKAAEETRRRTARLSLSLASTDMIHGDGSPAFVRGGVRSKSATALQIDTH